MPSRKSTTTMIDDFQGAIKDLRNRNLPELIQSVLFSSMRAVASFGNMYHDGKDRDIYFHGALDR
jgi:hypothetical protein